MKRISLITLISIICLFAAIVTACKKSAPEEPVKKPEPAAPVPLRVDANNIDPKDIPKGMVLVTGGEFIMGCNFKVDNDCEDDEKPAHRVYVPVFFIDKLETTVDQYGKCVEGGQCTEPGNNEDDEYCNYGGEDRGNHPVNCVTWDQAVAYCKFAGERLPTEAEWEKAARGTDGRIYPWGNKPADCDLAVMGTEGEEEEDDGCGKDSTWPMGSKPGGASPYGALDMAGNVNEWVSDWYSENYYSGTNNDNPKGPPSGTNHIIRGGSWVNGAEELRASYRDYYEEEDDINGIGFRCAKSP